MPFTWLLYISFFFPAHLFDTFLWPLASISFFFPWTCIHGCGKLSNLHHLFQWIPTFSPPSFRVIMPLCRSPSAVPFPPLSLSVWPSVSLSLPACLPGVALPLDLPFPYPLSLSVWPSVSLSLPACLPACASPLPPHSLSFSPPPLSPPLSLSLWPSTIRVFSSTNLLYNVTASFQCNSIQDLNRIKNTS